MHPPQTLEDVASRMLKKPPCHPDRSGIPSHMLTCAVVTDLGAPLIELLTPIATSHLTNSLFMGTACGDLNGQIFPTQVPGTVFESGPTV